MSTPVKQEIEAIGTVLQALEPLGPEARRTVLEYVIKRLSIRVEVDEAFKPPVPLVPGPLAPGAPAGSASTAVHIKTLKEGKKPKSAQEMAALVAYYLSELAPPAERKKTVNAKDVDTYFKIAEFRLPEQPRFTLPNAKKAGYLDAAGPGEYRLNPVGYNLVVHSLPRAGVATATSRPKKKRRGAAKATKARGTKKTKKGT